MSHISQLTDLVMILYLFKNRRRPSPIVIDELSFTQARVRNTFGIDCFGTTTAAGVGAFNGFNLILVRETVGGVVVVAVAAITFTKSYVK